MSIQSLGQCFSTVEHPRCSGKVEHRLVDVLAIAVCAVTACAESWDDTTLYGRGKLAWLRTFLELARGIPSHDTGQCAFVLIDPDAFGAGFTAWVGALAAGFKREGVVEHFDQHCFRVGALSRADCGAFDDTHGRLVRRRVFASTEAAALDALSGWPGLRTVLTIESIRSVSGAPKVEAKIRCFLSSCPDSPAVLGQAIRSHWAVENALHWVSTSRFRANLSVRPARTTAACATAWPRNLALLRKIAPNIVGRDRTSKASVRQAEKGRLERRLHAQAPGGVADELRVKPTQDFMRNPPVHQPCCCPSSLLPVRWTTRRHSADTPGPGAGRRLRSAVLSEPGRGRWETAAPATAVALHQEAEAPQEPATLHGRRCNPARADVAGAPQRSDCEVRGRVSAEQMEVADLRPACPEQLQVPTGVRGLVELDRVDAAGAAEHYVTVAVPVLDRRLQGEGAESLPPSRSTV